jgi:glycerol uptake facilitator protein
LACAGGGAASRTAGIPGKGNSDWNYAWVPIVGPVIGGILGAWFYKLLWNPA